MEEVGPSPSQTQQAAELPKAVIDGHRLIQQAHAKYMEALSIAADTELSSDDLLTVQQRGREYAGAVIQYSQAVMAWLGHINHNPKEAVKLFRKATSAE